MKIEVTQEDIDTGIPGSACGCPVALAFRRLGFHFADVAARSCFLAVGLTDGRVYSLPSIAADFISNFDTGREVKPLSFELEV